MNPWMMHQHFENDNRCIRYEARSLAACGPTRKYWQTGPRVWRASSELQAAQKSSREIRDWVRTLCLAYLLNFLNSKAFKMDLPFFLVEISDCWV